jgi:hypothetical protein
MLPAMLAKSILVLAVITASGSQPSNDPSIAHQRFFLTCVGTMRTAGVPSVPIAANGLVDLASRRMVGFGVGSAPILVMSEALIAFGSAADADGNRVEGSLDRLTGKTRIVVQAAKEPSEELIGMELDCRPAPSTS